MASPKEPNPNQPVDDEIYYDAHSSPQPPTQPAVPIEQDTTMAEATYPPAPQPPPAQLSRAQEIISQLSLEELQVLWQSLPQPALPQPAFPQPAFPQPALAQPALPQPIFARPALPQPALQRQPRRAQRAQTQHMPTSNLVPANAGPPNSIYTCPNCQRRGHPLRECPGPPDRFGYIPGCPKCHKLDHTLAHCPKGFTLQDVFHYIFSSRRNNFPMIWDTNLLEPEMGAFLSEAKPWTRGFARQQMGEHLARDWDWNPEGTVQDPAWNLNDPMPPQIHPQAPAKVSHFTPDEMQEWKQRRLDNARRRNEAEAAGRGADRFSRPGGQQPRGRSSSGIPGPARNQPGGQRAKGPDPIRRVSNNSRPRVGKTGKPNKPRGNDNAHLKLVEVVGEQFKRLTTVAFEGGSKDPKDWAQLGNQSRDRSRSSSRESVFGGSPGYRAASPRGSMLDNPRGRRVTSPAASPFEPYRGGRRDASPTASRYDPRNRRAASPRNSQHNPHGRRATSPTDSQHNPRRGGRRISSPAASQYDTRGRRSASPADTRFDDPRAGRRAASPQRSMLDSHRGNHRAASPQHSRFDNRDNRGNHRAPNPQGSRHDNPRGGAGGFRDNTRSQSNRRRSSPHSPFLDDPHRTESEDCQNCKQPGHHHTRCPQTPEKTAPTRAATQIERSFDTRVNHLPVPADRRTRPEGLCFNCMDPNHAWRECPCPCKICGQHGHGRQHCTKRN